MLSAGFPVSTQPTRRTIAFPLHDRPFPPTTIAFFLEISYNHRRSQRMKRVLATELSIHPKNQIITVNKNRFGALHFIDTLYKSDNGKNYDRIKFHQLLKRTMNLSLETNRLNKSVVIISSLTDKSDEKDYWLKVSPEERLIALERMRQINYGYDATTARLQRFFEIAELKTS